jgi:hypothetical protein
VAIFYRIVKTNPPMATDLPSDREAGRQQSEAALLRLWDGRSVFDSEEGARRMAQRFPVIGSFIAMLDIREGTEIQAERTLRTPGHHTLWGDTDDILKCVVSVVPV